MEVNYDLKKYFLYFQEFFELQSILEVYTNLTDFSNFKIGEISKFQKNIQKIRLREVLLKNFLEEKLKPYNLSIDDVFLFGQEIVIGLKDDFNNLKSLNINGGKND